MYRYRTGETYGKLLAEKS